MASKRKPACVVEVTKYEVPIAPNVAAVSADGKLVALGHRNSGGEEPALVVFAIEAKRKKKAFELSDEGTSIIDRTKNAYIASVQFLPDGRLLYVRDGDTKELVVCGSDGSAPSVLDLKDAYFVCVLERDIVLSRFSDDFETNKGAWTDTVRVPAAGERFAKPKRILKDSVVNVAVAGNRFYTASDRAGEWLGYDVAGKKKTLKWDVDDGLSKSRIRGDGTQLVFSADYCLFAMDVASGKAKKLEAPNYKNDVAVHDGRIMISVSTGELMLIDIESGAELWKEKVTTPKRSFDHVHFGNAQLALAAAAFQPFEVALLHIR